MSPTVYHKRHMVYSLSMTYRFTEHDKGYAVGKTLQPFRPQFAQIVSWVPRGLTVLDIGCGDGVLGATLIKEKSCHVWGFDLDSIGVKEAKRKGVRAVVHNANKRFPYKTNQFDVAICNEVLEFVEDPNLVISEALRVAGTAIIEFPNFGFWLYRIQLLLGHFPRFALYGHQWWNTRQTKFFSYADFLQLPSMQHTTIGRIAGIDWRNRGVSYLATRLPNLFARSVIIEIKK